MWTVDEPAMSSLPDEARGRLRALADIINKLDAACSDKRAEIANAAHGDPFRSRSAEQATAAMARALHEEQLRGLIAASQSVADQYNEEFQALVPWTPRETQDGNK